ncbi:hypothetical protein DDB_G0276569 [Dictyostelium discoideum AX4]|uniref:Elongator complex protein 5 n=1 Tax=Dictyostelium discoideum TaxID=44689 RepID=Q551I8_DICDI|nr:hypothetical protein DDB_G0276569 [Dictyostelium discoideum AX4]EAL69238.1 hypothetical protein DDB_G0276569 [Dictyostelium discoideum AX4]|eukprot:XP_643146.1 hypothetical protein DDB_G0276569 [Dictyostelium discoideum AX4]
MSSTIVSSIGSNSFTKVFSSSGSDAVGGLILLEDSLESSSQHLLNHLYSLWLPTISKQHRNIWFLNFSSTISEYKQLSKKYNNCNFIVIDYYSDSFGWNNNNNNNSNNNNITENLQQIPMIFKSVKHDSASIIKDIQNVYNCVPNKFKENPIILINSISTLILKSGLSDTCNLIRSLTNYNFNKVKQDKEKQEKEQKEQQDNNNNNNKKKIEKINKIETGIEGSVSNRIKMEKSFSCIFAILHTDLHEYEQSVQKQLQYISSVSIQVTPLSAKLKYSESLPHPYESTITLITKKRSGRVVRNVEYYYINNATGKVEFDSAESLQTKQEEQEPDPTQNLSFNLKLTEDEKQARDSVVLPYRHQGNNNEQTLLIEDPDDEDFDDEDPDDDLDI